MAKKFLKQHEILLRKAKVDLHSAKLLLKAFNDGDMELDLEIIFFHLHQSAEKLLKSILDRNRIKFPHSHDIEELIILLNRNNIKIIQEADELVLLTEYAVEGRYSIIHDDLDNAEKYIKILDKIIEYIKNYNN